MGAVCDVIASIWRRVTEYLRMVCLGPPDYVISIFVSFGGIEVCSGGEFIRSRFVPNR